MKLSHSKDWYEKRIALEGDVEVGAGVPPGCQPRPVYAGTTRRLDARMAFGTFVELWRRNCGWDAGTLAKEAGVSAREILEIEHDPESKPERETVCKLAAVFKLSTAPLLKLAGLMEPQTLALRETAVRHDAKTEPAKPLNEQERKALESIMASVLAAAQKP